MGASGLVVSNARFVRAIRSHPDLGLAAMLTPLDEWALSNGIAS
jgi:hypothetical protein